VEFKKRNLFIRKELKMNTFTKTGKNCMKIKKMQMFMASLLIGISIQVVQATHPPHGYNHSFDDNEVLGYHRYTGVSVVRQRTVLQHWQDPARRGPEFTRNNQSEDGAIQGRVFA
jgi:hypothetical protein